MAYQVIARKWRPQTFEEVTGQESITRTLRNAIEHDRLHHAYLFSGARGVGKTTTARLLAKALNCHKFDKPTATPCAIDDPTACASCREIAEGRTIDVQEIDAASTTGVQNVRDSIIDTLGIAPARDRFKVFIIDEVHMLSTQAFNALLKTLEEPPPRVVFILATTQSHKLPDTILSRCQHFEFHTIATTRIAEGLRRIAKAEGISVTDGALREIARAGEGSMRDAQSAFDQVISFAGPEIKAENVEAALGIASTETLARVVNGIAAGQPAEALAVVDNLVMRGHDLRGFCRDLLGHLRDLLVVKVSDGTADFLESAASNREELMRQAAAFSESDLIRFFHSLAKTENALRDDAAHPRYQLEIGLVTLMEMRRLEPLQQIIGRLEALEEASGSGAVPGAGQTPPASGRGSGSQRTAGKASKSVGQKATSAIEADDSRPTVSPPEDEPPFDDAGFLPAFASPTGPSAAPPATMTAENDNLLTSFENPNRSSAAAAGTARAPVMGNVSAYGPVIESIKTELEKRRYMLLLAALDGAQKTTFEGDELVIEFAHEAKRLSDALGTRDNIKILRDVCREVIGREVRVRISAMDAHTNQNPAASSTNINERSESERLREYAERHPAVQQLLNTFQAEIIDVTRIDSSHGAGGQEPE